MINKNIFQISIGLNHNHPEAVQSINNMRNSNPSWTYRLITDKKEVDNFMLKNSDSLRMDLRKESLKLIKKFPILYTQVLRWNVCIKLFIV